MTFGRYRPITQLGAGRDGVRFRADDPATGKEIELRVLTLAREDVAEWNRVAKRLRAAAMLDHVSAHRVIDLGLDDRQPYVAMEWVEPSSLATCQASLVGDRTESIAIMLGMARGLAAAHRLGLVHGALGPATIAVAWGTNPKIDWTGLDVSGQEVTLVDQELVVAFRPPEASSPGYQPEASTDVYALGRLLVWLLRGSIDRDGKSRLDDRGLEAVVDRLIAADPLDRPSARDAATALEVWQSQLIAGATSGMEYAGSNCETGVMDFAPKATPAPTINLLSEKEMLGRFRLVSKLGQGGMGTVYRAVDLADGSDVAVKVLSPAWAARPDALRRFLKEARLLAEVNSPHVTNFLEINEDDGLHYLALEFVKGTNLSEWLGKRGSVDEPTALAIMADVARALSVAHDRSILHRDVKPENILLLEDDPADPRAFPRVKLSDFGLARHVIESDSLVVTQAGAILGTPLYMSPEQCVGDALDARTDVYSMGATLFHLLAGRPPFMGPSPLAVISMHRNEPPPPLKSFNPKVSDAAAQIVAKSLAKLPTDRYQDASALLIDLERLLRGEPTGINIHPRLPECEAKELVQFDWRFDLEASPWQLWPHVSNTDRLNKAVGIPAVNFTAEPDPEGGVKRNGEFRKAGMTIGWREHPFEWVEGRRMGVLREYTSGPFRWFVSIIELSPKAGGGTTLHHRVRIATRGLLGRTLAAVEVGVKGKKAVHGVYHRIDAAILGKLGRDAALDPFEAPSPLSRDRQARLDRWVDSLGRRGLDPTLVERFGEFIAHAPAQEVARMRPLALARRLGVDPDGLVSACLLGAKEGTLILLWDLLCPVCRIPSQVIDTLRALKEHGNCEACQIDYEIDFANSVELIFRAHPEIRDTDVSVYCIGGPSHMPHVAAQARVGPLERIELDLALVEGAYRLRGPQLPFSIDFRVEPNASTDRWDLSLGRPPGPELPRSLRPGGQILMLANEFDRELVVRVERIAPREDALTAGRASTMALFRELFPGEILEPGQLVNVATATFVVTDLEDSARLYEALGDAGAFSLIHEHFRRIDAVIRREGGALIKTVDESVIAAFNDPVSAVQAALSLPAAVAPAGGDGPGLKLRVGVHRGPAMVATLNDHLDYFGSTVRIAAALPRLARGGEILLTQAVAAEPRVAALLEARGMIADVLPAAMLGLEEGFVELVRDVKSPRRDEPLRYPDRRVAPLESEDPVAAGTS
jgi:eukaryotic-like serine/threonine-protein kinase